MLSNTLRLNFCYFKIIQILHPRYHPKVTPVKELSLLKDRQGFLSAVLSQIYPAYRELQVIFLEISIFSSNIVKYSTEKTPYFKTV